MGSSELFAEARLDALPEQVTRLDVAVIRPDGTTRPARLPELLDYQSAEDNRDPHGRRRLPRAERRDPRGRALVRRRGLGLRRRARRLAGPRRGPVPGSGPA